METIRQGDVLLIKCNEPVDLSKAQQVKPSQGFHILAEGEATGHAHRVAQAMVMLWAVDAATRFLEVQGKTQVQHEEHGKLDLDPGFYQVVRQREYSPERIRNVAD